MLRINKNILYPEFSYKICGLCFYLHNKLGRYRNDKIILDISETFNNQVVTKEDYFQMRRYLSSYNKELELIINYFQK